jgi:mannitol-specific phosphotransferase system IIBC component
MEESPPIAETPPPSPKVPTMSLAARLLNVFAIPGDVFEEIKAAPHAAANWLVPALIASVVGAVSAFLMFSQPTIQQQLREKQEQMMEQQVKAGKMTRAQADQAMSVAQKVTGPTMMKIFGAFGAVASSFARVFWWALVLWLLSRWFLKIPISYLKATEVAGLAGMIATLGAIVTLLLIVNLGKLFSTPSLALTIGDFDEKNKSHLLLGAVNVFNFWLIGVLASGLGRLAGVPFARAAFLLLGYWIAWSLALIFIGLGTLAM